MNIWLLVGGKAVSQNKQNISKILALRQNFHGRANPYWSTEEKIWKVDFIFKTIAREEFSQRLFLEAPSMVE